ncbi:MAG: radical SAM family heme chaperone HemW [Lachnospiraceae bacterium]
MEEEKTDLSLYIHIPFCVRKCDYCDFLSFPVEKTGCEVGREEILQEYLRALKAEIVQESSRYVGRRVDTIFLGGGTPSLLLPGQIEDLMQVLHDVFAVLPEAEITIEANPGTLTRDKLKTYKEVGINRLSIGLQSTNDQELQLLGRIHRFEDFRRNYELARDCGFSNINIDLMSGLPGQKCESWCWTLTTVAELAPEHISAYGLIIEEGTPFYNRYGEKSSSEIQELPKEEEERQMYHDTAEILAGYGYLQYEISNYAKPGYECRHNTGYWIRKDYAGFGLGAASMVHNVRWKNTSVMEEYLVLAGKDDGMERVQAAGQTGEIKREQTILTLQEQQEEMMFLGLRMNRGVSGQKFYDLFGCPMESIYGDWLSKMEKEGLLLNEGSVRLTEKGRDLANFVMAGFLQ